MTLCKLNLLSQSIRIPEEHNIPLIFHKLTHPRTPPCSQKDIGIILSIMIAHDCANGLGCFPTVIKRNTGAVVVRNVGLSVNITTQRICGFGTHLDDVVEYVLTDEPKIAVHRRGGAALKVPSACAVVRECGVCVLKISYQYKPVIDPEIWEDVVTKDS